MATSQTMQDLFISHANADKQRYVTPLAEALKTRDVSYYLDNESSKWGDSFVANINDWFKNSRYTLVCLSQNFLSRQWTNTELEVALAERNEPARKKLLPLILNSKGEIFEALPIIKTLIYREFDAGVNSIADDLAQLVKGEGSEDAPLRVTIESKHTGRMSYLKASPRESVAWLAQRARQSAGVKEEVDAGMAFTFKIRWVLVDKNAESAWHRLSVDEQLKVRAVVKSAEKIKVSYVFNEDRLEDLGVTDNVVFYLYGVDGNRRWVADTDAVTPDRGPAEAGSSNPGASGGWRSGAVFEVPPDFPGGGGAVYRGRDENLGKFI
jgi:hypothetical protein